jgi:hypothetical protein
MVAAILLVLDEDVALEDGGPEDSHLGSALVQAGHFDRLLERG